jgi:hypothetical protein
MKQRMQLSLQRARECERTAAIVTDPKFREQWLDLARQWRELVESARKPDDEND